ncbi:hypothetical protein JCM13304A_20110 [Desulfothermus okinawensis JCM 13304]
MAIFDSTEKMYEVLGSLWRDLLSKEEMAKKFQDAGIVIKFSINSPNGEIWLFPDREEKVVCGKADGKPDVEMFLSGDDCHKFWMQELKLPIALATRKIKAKGPINKILKLLPMLKPAYEKYPQIAKDHGLI